MGQEPDALVWLLRLGAALFFGSGVAAPLVVLWAIRPPRRR